MNNSGSFVGEFRISRNNSAAYRYSDSNGEEYLAQKSAKASGINLEGDVFIEKNARGYLYTDEHGLLNLDDLVVGSDADLAMWFAGDIGSTFGPISDRNMTGFGQLCGSADFEGIGEGFVLTPVSAP